MAIDRHQVFRLAHEGLWTQNPALIGLLGLCPLLAVSTTIVNGIAMGLVTTVVLTLSAGLISLLKQRIAPEVRLPLFMLILASMVTLADLLMAASIPEIHAVIGLFIPLIVTNCVILGRIEAFAYRQTFTLSLLDSLFMGLGFTGVTCLLASVREILGTGMLFNHAEELFGDGAIHWNLTLVEHYPGFLTAIQPAGAFILLGLILAGRNAIIAQERSPRETRENPLHHERR